jgi:hypothetical protein
MATIDPSIRGSAYINALKASTVQLPVSDNRRLTNGQRWDPSTQTPERSTIVKRSTKITAAKLIKANIVGETKETKTRALDDVDEVIRQLMGSWDTLFHECNARKAKLKDALFVVREKSKSGIEALAILMTQSL